MKTKFTFLFLFLCLVSTGCDRNGTETGNPTITQPEYSDPANGTTDPILFVDELVFEACSKLADCEGAPTTDCTTSWQNLTDVDEEIGLSPGDYADLNETRTAESDDDITPDVAAADACLADIQGLSCAAPEVANAYDSGSGTPFALGAQMIPTSCQGVF